MERMLENGKAIIVTLRNSTGEREREKEKKKNDTKQKWATDQEMGVDKLSGQTVPFRRK